MVLFVILSETEVSNIANLFVLNTVYCEMEMKKQSQYIP